MLFLTEFRYKQAIPVVLVCFQSGKKSLNKGDFEQLIGFEGNKEYVVDENEGYLLIACSQRRSFCQAVKDQRGEGEDESSIEGALSQE